jgi:hypothetical protein
MMQGVVNLRREATLTTVEQTVQSLCASFQGDLPLLTLAVIQPSFHVQ